MKTSKLFFFLILPSISFSQHDRYSAKNNSTGTVVIISVIEGKITLAADSKTSIK
jgi:hypothetical protein